MSMWDQSTVALVTGVRQGIGRAVAEELGQKMTADNSLLILTSRTMAGAEAALQEIKTANPKLNVCVVLWDLAKTDYQPYEDDIKSCVEKFNLKPTQFKQYVLIHNAASLGDMTKKVSEWKNPQDLITENNINVVTMFMINTAFLTTFQSATSKFIVNLTGNSASIPLTCFGQPGMGKASRAMGLSILALENPEIRVLHFNPGLADSEALRGIESTSHDPNQRSKMSGAYQSNKVEHPRITARALAAVLEKNEFKSGSVHVHTQ